MKLQTLIAAIVIAAIILAPTRAHAGDCTEDGSSCGGFVLVLYGAVIAGEALDAAIGLGGLVAMIGGANDVAHHRSTVSWRVLNYIFGGLNLAAGLTWGILAANHNIDPTLGVAVAVPHLAIGAADLTVAVLSTKHSRDVVSVSIAPMAGRDISNHAINGASLKLTF
jgi:hypothetical protein